MAFFALYICILLSASLLGIYVFKKLREPFKALCILLVFSSFTEILSREFDKYYNTPNPIYHFYAPISFIIHSVIFYFLLQNSRPIRTIIMICGFSALPVSLINTNILQPVFTFPSNILFFNIILLSAYSIILFYFLLKFPEDSSILKNPGFWFAAGTLIFQATSFIHLGFDRLIIKRLSYSSQVLIDDIVLYFAALMYLLYGLATYLDSIRPKK